MMCDVKKDYICISFATIADSVGKVGGAVNEEEMKMQQNA